MFFFYLTLVTVFKLVPRTLNEGRTANHINLVRTTFSSFSRPNHLGILALRLFCVKKFPILEDKTIF